MVIGTRGIELHYSFAGADFDPHKPRTWMAGGNKNAKYTCISTEAARRLRAAYKAVGELPHPPTLKQSVNLMRQKPY